MTNNRGQKETVSRAFDYSKFDNIDESDDEDRMHPNIEKSFNVRINKQVRDRKIGEHEHEREHLEQRLKHPNVGGKEKREIEMKLKDLDSKKNLARREHVRGEG